MQQPHLQRMDVPSAAHPKACGLDHANAPELSLLQTALHGLRRKIACAHQNRRNVWIAIGVDQSTRPK
jgi:hypothetical protein